MGLLFNNNKSTVPKGNELLKFILFWFPMETMQRETSPPSCVFVSTCPSAITTHWPISLSYDRGTTGSDIISFYFFFFFFMKMSSCGEKKNCVSVTAEGKSGTKV